MERGLTYIRRDNEVVYPPPYQQAGTFLTAWVVPSPRDKQKQVVDAQLNGCPGGQPFEYRPLLNSVMLVLADIDRVTSLDPAGSKLGWVPEQDICLWIPCGAFAKVDGEWVLDHLVFFVPYIWVTNAYTMATGREVFGYPKAFAWAQLPRDPSDAGPLWADGLVLPTFSPDTEVTRQRIVTLSREVNAPDQAANQDYGAGQQLEAFESLVRLVAQHGGCDLNLCAALLGDLLKHPLPMVVLTQCRAAASAEGACYQAIVEANATVNAFHGAGRLAPGWRLDLQSYASVDIPRHLGIEPQQRVDLAFWVRFSFSMDLATEVWSAGGAA